MAEGEFALVRQYLDRAQRGASDPVRWGSAVTEMDFNVLSADAAAQAGDLQSLRRYLPAAHQEVTRYGHRLYAAIVLRARCVEALLEGRETDAVGIGNDAVAAFEALGAPYQTGLALAERARAWTSLQNLTLAREDWERAAGLFGSLGARPSVQRAREALERLPAQS